VARKHDLRRVDAICREFGLTGQRELRFRDYLHECKESGDFGTGGEGNYTTDELREKAREFIDHEGHAS
jgi:hypothetical protein